MARILIAEDDDSVRAFVARALVHAGHEVVEAEDGGLASEIMIAENGRFDLLLNSTNADLLEQVAAGDGKWHFRKAGSIARQNIEGHDVSPTTVDFDADGVADFLGGAEDGHFYFLKNPRAKR